MRILFLLLTTAFCAAAAGAAGWEFHEDEKSGRQVAACTVAGTAPNGPAKATLVLHHRRGQPLKLVKEGILVEFPITIALCLNDYESVKGFDFLAFEGADAAAADKRLVSVTIEAGKERFAKRFTQSGGFNHLAWLLHGYSAPDRTKPADFTFGIGNPLRDVKDFITITKLLQQSPTKLEVTVTDSKDPKHTLHFTFPTDNAAEVIGKLMR